MTAPPITPRTYDGFVKPKTAGLGHMGTILSGIALALLIFALFLVRLAGPGWGIGFGLVTGLALCAVAIPDPHGRTRIQNLATRVAWKMNPGKTYVSGPLTRLGSWLLPGILAQTDLTEWVAADGREYGMVHTPSTNHYAVTWECHPDGASMVDPSDLVANVDRWGDWLDFLCLEPSAVQVMVTIETQPDQGHTLKRALLGKEAANPPELAAKVVRELVGSHAVGTPSCRSFVTVTFEGDRGTSKRKVDEMSRTLATRLPSIGQKLSGSGAGPSRLMSAQAIIEVIRGAYDPGCALSLADARASGMPVVMRYDALGPPAANNDWDHYRHSSGVSVTWSMSEITGGVTEQSLVPLLQSHQRLTRKRVSLIYRLHDPAVAPTLVASDLRAADFSVNVKRGRQSARSKQAVAKAETNADHEATGRHGLVEIGAMVTVTLMNTVDPITQKPVTAVEQLPLAQAEVDSLAPTSRMRLRKNDGTHAASFALNLPCVGQVAYELSLIPAAVQEAL